MQVKTWLSQRYNQHICINPTHGFYWPSKLEVRGWVATEYWEEKSGTNYFTIACSVLPTLKWGCLETHMDVGKPLSQGYHKNFTKFGATFCLEYIKIERNCYVFF